MKLLNQGLIAVLTVTSTLSSTLIAIPAQSQEPAIDCKAAKTQMAMNYCAYQDFKAADAELNQVYRQLRKSYKGMAQDRQLVDAQLVWIKFRDADCKFSADRFKGGSIAPLIYSGCQTNLTKQRIESLKTYLEMSQL